MYPDASSQRKDAYGSSEDPAEPTMAKTWHELEEARLKVSDAESKLDELEKKRDSKLAALDLEEEQARDVGDPDAVTAFQARKEMLRTVHKVLIDKARQELNEKVAEKEACTRANEKAFRDFEAQDPWETDQYISVPLSASAQTPTDMTTTNVAGMSDARKPGAGPSDMGRASARRMYKSLSDIPEAARDAPRAKTRGGQADASTSNVRGRGSTRDRLYSDDLLGIQEESAKPPPDEPARKSRRHRRTRH